MMRGRLSILLLFFGGFLLAWLLALPQWGGPGMTWDEAYYYPPFVHTSQWVGQLLTAPGAALSGEGIRAGWQEINELPPVVKWIGAASVSLGGEGWWRLALMRLYPAAAFGLALVLLRLIARRLMPDLWAWLPVLLYVLHPRVLGHAQIAATESVFAAVTLLTIWVALHDLRRLRWAILLVVCCGVALATKVNGLILIAVVLFWLATRRLIDRRMLRVKGAMSRDLLLCGAIVVGAPLVAWMIWPWMWDDTLARVREYYYFIRLHLHQGIWFFGKRWNYNVTTAPLYYPFVMAHLTAPLVLIVCFYVGLASGISRLAARRRFPQRAYLVALFFLAPFVASSLPGSPKYDGIRLFFPVLAPAALIASLGTFWASRWAAGKWHLPTRRIAAVPFAALLLAFPISRPSIDYYNLPTRLSGGDGVFPFEQTYWGNALDREVVNDLNAILPPNAKVKTLALQPATLEIYRQWGVLREDIEINPEPPFDVHLLQNRRGFWVNAEWSLFSNRTPLATWGEGVGGEPLVFLYDGEPPQL